MPHSVECTTDIRRDYRDFVMKGNPFRTSDSLVHKAEGASSTSAFAEAILQIAKEGLGFHMVNEPLVYQFAEAFSQNNK